MSTLFLLLSLAGFITGIVLVIFHSNAEEKFVFKPSLPYGLLGAALFVLFLSFTTVDAGTVGVVTKFGQVNRTLPPGAHFVLPFAENVHTITTQTLVVKPSEDAASHDLQIVHTQVTLAYHFDPSYVGFIYTQLADASDNSVENKVVVPAILEAIKSQTAQYDAQALIAQRPAVRDGIENFVKERMRPYHIIPETVSITDFKFSEEYDKAIEAKVTAQQNAEKASNDLTRIKIEADQKVAAAEGEAKALKAQKEQITPELLQLRTIEMMDKKWDGRLPENYYGGSSPLPIVEALKKAGK